MRPLFNTEINYPEDHSRSHIFQKSGVTFGIIMTPEPHVWSRELGKKKGEEKVGDGIKRERKTENR